MENLVVLTGAGASVVAGGKTMINLEDAVLNAVGASNLSADVVQILKDRRQATQSTTNQALGFEDWLSYVVNASYLGAADASPFSHVVWKGNVSPEQEEITNFVREIGKAIFCECALTLMIFFSRPLAVVGNTGSGKSFTVSSLIQKAMAALADRGNEPHIFVLDINGEYGRAFAGETSTDRKPDHIYLNGAEFGIPLWFFNASEICAWLSAEIVTGDRRVIEYILSPLLRYRSEAGRER